MIAALDEIAKAVIKGDLELAAGSIAALGRIADLGVWRRRDPGRVPIFADVDVAAARGLAAEVLAESPEGRWLDTNEIVALLGHVGAHMVPTAQVSDAAAAADLAARQAALEARHEEVAARLEALAATRDATVAVFASAEGARAEIPVAEILDAYRPNSMGVTAKLGHYLGAFWAFVSDEPRDLTGCYLTDDLGVRIESDVDDQWLFLVGLRAESAPLPYAHGSQL